MQIRKLAGDKNNLYWLQCHYIMRKTDAILHLVLYISYFIVASRIYRREILYLRMLHLCRNVNVAKFKRGDTGADAAHFRPDASSGCIRLTDAH